MIPGKAFSINVDKNGLDVIEAIFIVTQIDTAIYYRLLANAKPKKKYE